MMDEAELVLKQRFARTVTDPGAPDWGDVVRRARPRRPRRRLLLAAAALIGILVVAGSAIALGGGSTGIPAIDDLLDRTSRPHEPGQPATGVQPVPGSLSPPLEFDLDGKPLVAVGFQNRSQGMICSALVSTAERRYGGVGCLSQRILRDALAERPAHVFAGGGSGARRAIHGFARADVVGVSLHDGQGIGRIELSEPWKPEPWEGEPIRFFYAFTAPGAEPEAGVPPWGGLRIEARLANGTTANVLP
jgi:hypothetical protein